MAKKLDPQVEAHIHKDLDVTPARVRAFGKAPYAVRLSVLAQLRARSSDRSSSMELAIMGLALAIIAVLVAPSKGIDLQSYPLGGGIAIGLFLGFIAIIALLPVVVPQVLRHHGQQAAHVWLAAYEDEIARRAAKGK